MKIQDGIFFLLLFLLCIIRKEKWFLYVGLLCYASAIPLFAGWIFFTAEHLTWYGSGYILVYLVKQLLFIPDTRLNT